MDAHAAHFDGQDDSFFMRLALQQGELSSTEGEIPVGAVVVKNGQVIAVGRNSPIQTHDPSAHAEINALRAAAKHLGNYRLDGCELYVTLEPCAMCAGAMLHARLKRVVFGARDAKTGAAGSVVDLFAQTELNHHTSVTAGILQDECAHVLSKFFQTKRIEKRSAVTPLREDSLRTAEQRFAFLQDEPFASGHESSLHALGGRRMHYFSAGDSTKCASSPTFLCLHDFNTWAFTFHALLCEAANQAHAKVIAPDLMGFGMSDKPKREDVHTPEAHRESLWHLVESLDLRNIVFVLQGSAALLGLGLPLRGRERFAGLVLLDPLPEAVALVPKPTHVIDVENVVTYLSADQENAPYPDAGHKAGPRALAAMRGTGGGLDGLANAAELTRFYCEDWTGATVLVQHKQLLGAQTLASRRRKPLAPPACVVDTIRARALLSLFAAG
jgi:tRNA(adenine34) deaminase